MVLLLGGSGYIGNQFLKELKKMGINTYDLSRSEYDYYDVDTLRRLIKTKGIKFLINCAGYTGKPNVDACEDNQKEALRGNVTLPRVIAKACRYSKVPWAHVSSGCIYNGTKGANGFTEKDVPNFTFDYGNCSYYSGTKAMAEEALLKESDQCYIWRLRIPFDEFDGSRNYLSKLMRYPMLLSVDNSISHRGDFVKYCLALWQAKADFGIYNVVNTGAVTAKQITEKMKEILNNDMSFKFFQSEQDMYSLGAARTPRSNCVLDNTKLRKALYPKRVRTALKAVEHSLKHWIEEGKEKKDNGIPNSYWD
jgi:UDP-glucose 4,6-dehydratase